MTRADIEEIVAEACGEPSGGVEWRAAMVGLAPLWANTFDDCGIAARLGYELGEVRMVTARLRGAKLWDLDGARNWVVALDLADDSVHAFVVAVALLALCGAGLIQRIPADRTYLSTAS